jgi:two-component system CheB/CheR fusion protein
MAFVVVSHQAPTGQSLLPEILAKTTAMPVSEIVEKTRAEPNHVYVAPRGHYVTIRGGVLSLEQVIERGHLSLPIDFFFRALAQDQERRAVGIVLSGTGADGTLGLAAIRAGSGVALVQDPATAEFEGMPSSAIGAGAADFVLTMAEMPARLLAYERGLRAPEHQHTAGETTGKEMERILAVIRIRGGHDFSAYKRETLLRRIQRRMHLHHFETLEEYAGYLEANDEEIDALWRDWLIGVSSFFRDPEAFQALAESALPALLATRGDDAALRIWIPGCATGEEVYSIAIVVRETLERLSRHMQVRIFATDLDPGAIQVARAGRYSEGIAADVSSARLARFFEKEDRSYRVRKELRNLLVFAIQNVLSDPPLTHVDLIACRNLLIYVEPSAQRDVIPVFHYSLNPGGLLLLGSSESVNDSGEFFSVLDKRWKLFLRNDAAVPRPMLHWPELRYPGRKITATRVGSGRANPDLRAPLHAALAERFGPPAVLVDERGQIQQVHGRVGSYLELPSGRVNVDIVEMAREGLRAPLASALRAAIEDGSVVEKRARVRIEGRWLSLQLTVAPLRAPSLAPGLLLVSFEPGRLGTRSSADKGAEPPGHRPRDGERELEAELQQTRLDLQSSIDELRAANEELASANEEVQSSNEELQSTNEELQTAKEEAQSLNEELQTVNAELTEKLEAFEHANDDLLNLMNSIEIATIFLDDRLRVKSFTPEARKVARLIDSDVGRPLADLAILLDYPGLLSDAASVLKSLHASETQAPARDGTWYAVRIRPYRTVRNVVDGLVVTFVDTTETRRSERAQAALILAEGIVDAVRAPLLVLDKALRIVRANGSYYREFGVSPAETDGRLIQDLGNRQWDIPALRERLAHALHSGEGFDDFEVDCTLPGVGRRRMILNARPLPLKASEPAELMVLSIEDGCRTAPPGSGSEVQGRA